jgi:hypothetical protein
MEHLGLYERAFIRSCDYLGIKWLKRYWIVNGSAYNQYHMNKNSIHDLEKVIKNADHYDYLHLTFSLPLSLGIPTLVYLFKLWWGFPLISQWSLLGILGFTDSRWLILGYVPPLMYELGAFVLHHYNRTLARAHIQRIRSMKISSLN